MRLSTVRSVPSLVVVEFDLFYRIVVSTSGFRVFQGTYVDAGPSVLYRLTHGHNWDRIKDPEGHPRRVIVGAQLWHEVPSSYVYMNIFY